MPYVRRDSPPANKRIAGTSARIALRKAIMFDSSSSSFIRSSALPALKSLINSCTLLFPCSETSFFIDPSRLMLGKQSSFLPLRLCSSIANAKNTPSDTITSAIEAGSGRVKILHLGSSGKGMIPTPIATNAIPSTTIIHPIMVIESLCVLFVIWYPRNEKMIPNTISAILSAILMSPWRCF